MATHEMRAEARINVTQRGKLSDGQEWFPCMVLDMSNSGFLMVCTRPLPVGTTLDFRCELYPDKFLDCKVEVMHVESEGMGTMITEIDDKTSSLYQTYLEEIYVERMSKNRKPHPKEE